MDAPTVVGEAALCRVCEHPVDPVTAPTHPSCESRSEGDMAAAIAALLAADLISVDALRAQGVLE
jgi:hypothetical protein